MKKYTFQDIKTTIEYLKIIKGADITEEFIDSILLERDFKRKSTMDMFLGKSFENKKTDTLEKIAEYLSSKYDELTVFYEHGDFIIEGNNSIQQELCSDDLKEMLGFSRKKK